MEVFINGAMSIDGKLSSVRREQIEISGEKDFERVDRLRAESDAILVGVGTVLSDDPSLTVKSDEIRSEKGKGNPIRVIADSRARTPPNASVFDSDGKVVIGVSSEAPEEKIERLREKSKVVETSGKPEKSEKLGTSEPSSRTNLGELLNALEEMGVESLMVEGGGEVNYSLVKKNLVNRISVYIGPKIIGGRDAPTLVDGDGFVEDFPEAELVSVEKMDGGVVLEWKVEKKG